MPGALRLDAIDREFLPAALEIFETPPSPIRVAGIWLICIAAAAGLAWAYFGWLEIYAVAQGRIQPSGRSKVVQPLEAGKVAAIAVENGSHVANYSSVKRVSCGTKEQNTAQLWVTLFFLGANPPENMTLHGAHDFGSGGEIGGISAASSAFAAHIGKQFRRVGNTLTIG